MEKRALLVVSFGTSYRQTREKTIDVIERELDEAACGFDLKRAFTSSIIMKKLKERDGIFIDNVGEAMERLLSERYEHVVVQPTHILNGDEYEKMLSFIEPYSDKFKKISVGKPLLTSSDDYDRCVAAMMKEIGELKEDEAAVLMGHGSEHFSDAAYAALDYRFKVRGYSGVFVGTVEGFPEIDDILMSLKKRNPKKVKLLPLMIVAGDHAINDMASDEDDSWNSILKSEGYETEVILKGMGEIAEIRDIFKEHMLEAMEE